MNRMKIKMFGVLLVWFLILQDILAQGETNMSCPDETRNTTDDACNTTELYNSTFSGETVTDIDSTTEAIETTSVTQPTSTTIEAVTEARPISNEACTCDLIVDSCDINCCCDTGCTDKDRLAFSECVARPQYNFDPRHCYKTQFIYHNNTEFRSIQGPNGLFCVVRDNLPSRFLYQNRRVVNTLWQFNKLRRSHKTFSWPSQHENRPRFVPAKHYRAGDFMWTLVNRTLVPFRMPVSVTSALCQTWKIMHYLDDWSGECSRTVSDIEVCENDPGLSAISYYAGFTILSAPHLLNESQFQQDCPANICIPVTTFLCSVGECSQVSDIEYPVYNSETGVCHSVVKELKYTVYHNGTDGITKVILHVFLTNVTSQNELTQRFSISFHWTKDTDNLFHRSGNPGYIVGKPVMTGRKVTQIINTEEDIDKEAIEVSKNSKDWLSIAAAMSNGECNLDKINENVYRQTVTFGENRLSSCVVSVTRSNFTSASSCAAMQKTLLHLLGGSMMENVTLVNKFNLYVATFGDSKVEDTGDWVQVIPENVPSLVTIFQKGDWSLICKSIVTSIHIDIMYAHVGSLAVPQAKILGVVFQFGQSHNVIYTCSSLNCNGDNQKQHIRVVSSVSFIDVTKPPVTEFAEPPVYEVKLPHDFFYPFFSSSSYLSPIRITFILLVTLIIIMN